MTGLENLDIVLIVGSGLGTAVGDSCNNHVIGNSPTNYAVFQKRLKNPFSTKIVFEIFGHRTQKTKNSNQLLHMALNLI
jgi:hypothetical protein